MLFSRVPVLISALTLGVGLPALAQPAPQYPPGAYQQQPAPYPQAEPQPYAQPQPQPGYPQPYPQPSAADPYAPAPGYPGYGLAAEAPVEMVSSALGALQLSLSTTVVRYRSNSVSYDNMGPEFSTSTVDWGFSDSAPLYVEVGYGILDQLVIGGVLQLGGESVSQKQEGATGESDSSTFDFTLMPKAEYQFSPTSKINPFVGGMLGLGMSSASSDTGQGAAENSALYFSMLLRAGLRCFLSEGFSVDPQLVGGFAFGGGSSGVAGMADQDFGLSAFQVGLAVGLSGWLR